MSKSKKNDHVGRRNCSNGFCRLCGEPYPFQLVERADSCAQWCNYFTRNMPDPGNVAAILCLSLICRLCILQTALNRGLKAAEHFTDAQDMFPVDYAEER